MALTVDWNAIHPLNGKRADGFEELCAQLARAESPANSCYERKGTPDAGIECYAVLTDGSEWGWQAKYFNGLGDSQWTQLDDSVKTALKKHPKLVRYFVCTPLDRPDGRIPGRKSAKKRWDDHVNKWSGWASERGISVEFVYWGSSELLERLSRPEHVGRLHFWFDTQGFDHAWFTARLDEALKTAGPRYTPEIHVDLPIASELETFGRTDIFFSRIKSHARSIRKNLQVLRYSKVTDPSFTASLLEVSKTVQVILDALGSITVQPIGYLPFQDIVEQIGKANTATSDLENLLFDCEKEYDTNHQEPKEEIRSYHNRDNPFRECRFRLQRLVSELNETHEELNHAQVLAGSSLMLLNGKAGTGKTHLLCDTARNRITAGRPTVLLMGQQFTSQEPPWVQATQQLDLPGLSAEEFVGALEAAAQAADCRALVMIDAINEGSGRLLWPAHLSAFLAHIERSPWIGVLLSVRSSYEEIVLPETIRERAAAITHYGFAEYEYDATQTFFVHYGLELPSTPLLAPEFRNPLFLKTLCRGLNAKGERQLPRGFHGITSIFDFYLNAINERLASSLDYNPKTNLVRQALEGFTKAVVKVDKHSLKLNKAEETVNALLPGRSFERSLYRGLVTEGLLIEEVIWLRDSAREEVVFIGYERFADHIFAKTLLDSHLEIDNPESAFEGDGPLSWLWDKGKYVAEGLIEAMCIQIPERTGQELITLAPKLMERWGIGDSFRQSLVWRDLKAFSESTRKVLNKLIRNEHDWHDTQDVLLTVTTLAGHPFNARFLDQRLRKDTMPDRDVWWSTYLHEAWGCHGAVDRLVDWAWSITSSTTVDEESIELSATTLAWMLTSSNRFLRDRVTKALVSLLTNRLDAAVWFVDQFSDVDDPYVMERIYAVAYGVSMRNQDQEKAGSLAECVYRRVFAEGTPPPHILLRDYARGVVERALYLGAPIDVEVELIRPPYQSTWPHIPTKEEIEPFMPDWSRGDYDSGEHAWARNRIGSSVMSDDFARYVIGTNSSSTSHTWLSIRLNEPLWQSIDEQLEELASDLSEEVQIAWELFEEAEKKVVQSTSVINFIVRFNKNTDDSAPVVGNDSEEIENKLSFSTGKAREQDIEELKKNREATLSDLKRLLSKKQADHLEKLLLAKQDQDDRPPRFKLSHMQRYILQRVFDLGWTTERFGQFDRFSISDYGRESSKAERIGKKYQWIAYHEILAFLADHFQYRTPYRDSGDRSYDGPWQENYRDIDPSCTLRASTGGTSWDGHVPSWWAEAIYDNWGDLNDPKGWTLLKDDLPKMEDLLSIVHPANGSRWANVQSYFNWKQQTPPDHETTDVERRELWYICTGYLIRSEDAESFMEWASKVDFWGRWMPDPPEIYQMFLGEHGWSSASLYFQQPYFGDDGWKKPGHACPTKIRPLTFEYLCEVTGLDCSLDEGYTLHLPTSELISGLGLQWSGIGADFLDTGGILAAFDPTAHATGPSALLLREDLLKEFLEREGLAVCWAVIGEKRVLGAGFEPGYDTALRISGAFMLKDEDPVGFLTFKHDSE